MDWKKLVIAALAFVVIAEIVHTAGALVFMGYYADPANFHLWSGIMMPSGGAPGAEFFAASIAVNAVVGAITAWAYMTLHKSIPGKGMSKGINYGLLVFLLAAVPGALSSLVLLSVPAGLVVAWMGENLLVYLLGGLVFSRTIR
jgi:hypothetical protein